MAQYRDFRNYLETADPYALAYTGNDARIDPTKTGYDTRQFSTETDRDRVQNYISGLYQKYQNIQNPSPTPLPSLYGAGGQVYAPKLDIAAVNAKARAQAEGAVNPYYTKLLNDFLAQQASQRQRQQQQYETNVTNMEDQLKNTLEQNELTGQRTAEDVATDTAQINQTADEFQTDSGQEFDQARLEIARQASAGGLGAQKVEGATKARNTQETRQVQKFQEAKQQRELFKGRTFADLAKSSELAKTSTEKGKKQAKFDLDSYIEGSVFDEQNKRNELEQSRLEAISRESGNQGKLLFNRFLAGIRDPAKYQAAVQTYGGAF